MLLSDPQFVEFVINKILKEIILTINPKETYWKNKTWADTIKFRRGFEYNEITNGERISEIMIWGTIPNFKHEFYANNIEKTIESLSKNVIDSYTARRITSFSKLFSFYDPNKYFIFEARVALSLNSLFFYYCKNNPNEFDNKVMLIKYTGKSRNPSITEKENKFSKIPANDIGTTMEVKDIYTEYNKFILNIHDSIQYKNALENSKLKDYKNHPELIEMILFFYYEKIFKKCVSEITKVEVIRHVDSL